MHSSRMRTARLLPVSPSMHCSGVGGGGIPGPGSVIGPGGGEPGLRGTCPGTPPVNRMTDRQV